MPPLSKKELKVPGCEPITIKDSTAGVTAAPKLTGEDKPKRSRRRRQQQQPTRIDNMTAEQVEAEHLEFLIRFQNFMVDNQNTQLGVYDSGRGFPR